MHAELIAQTNYESRLMKSLKIVNQITLLGLAYIQICYTDYVLKYVTGDLIVNVFIANVLTNLAFHVHKNAVPLFRRIKRKWVHSKLKKKKKLKVKPKQKVPV